MLRVTIETDNGTTVVNLTAAEQKAFEYVANMPVDWIENAIRERVRHANRQIVKETSDKNPNRIDATETAALVDASTIKSAKIRTEEAEASDKGKL